MKIDNPFIYTNDNKRYHTWNYYLRNRFHNKIFKVPLNANFSCPNRDGKVAYGGCTFCGKLGSGEQVQEFYEPLNTQYDANKEVMLRKWPQGQAIAYFQAYTNTYCDLSTLKATIQPFFDREEVVALSIATRADCLEDDKIAYLKELAKTKEVWVELGLQTIHDDIAEHINRGHTYAVFLDCVNRLQHTDIKICAHIMNSLPKESIEMMIENVSVISQLPIHALKIHMLYISKNTFIANEYEKTAFHLLTKEEYVDLVIRQLEYVPKEIIIQRLTGDGVEEDLIAPTWSLNKTSVLNEIDKEMKRRNTYQGKRLEN